MLQVRPATTADRDRVIQIALACDPEDWLPGNYEQLLNQPNSGLMVAEAEGQMVGCFAYEWHPDRQQAYLMGMRIDPAVQGKGLGSAFCKAQIDALTAAGAHRLTLLSEHENERAHRTVERNGFVKTTAWFTSHLAPGALLEQLAPARESSTEAVGTETVGRGPATTEKPVLEPATDELRQWWANKAAGQCAGLPDSGWIIFPLTEAAFTGDLFMHDGTEGALLWGRYGNEWIIRWASGSPQALRRLLTAFAHRAQEGGAELITISLPGDLEPILQEAGLDLPEPWHAYLFVYTSQATT